MVTVLLFYLWSKSKQLFFEENVIKRENTFINTNVVLASGLK